MKAKPDRIFTGKPCRNGHIAERFGRYRRCIECHRIVQAAWRSENGDKTRAMVASWRERNRQHCRDYTKKWQTDNPERMRQANESFYLANQEREKARAKRYYYENPEKAKAGAHRRIARIHAAEGSHTASELREIFKAQKGRCAYCRIDLRKLPSNERHLDHIKPISRGGSNDRTNLQFACKKCNQKKNKKDALIFARQMGMLL